MRTAGAVAGVLALTLFAPGAAHAGLVNGSFTEGAGERPSGWDTQAWDAASARFAWEPPVDGAGAIRIESPTPNDARWCQPVAVEPGTTYRVAAHIKTEDVGTETAGALIAIEPRIADSRDVRGTRDWQPVAVSAKATGERWEICVRLGSYSNLNTGTAWFRDVTLEPIGRTSARAPRWRPWDALRAASGTAWGPIATPLAGGLLLALGLGVVGRRRRPTPPTRHDVPPAPEGF